MESLRERIKRELPALLREDPELRAFILELTRQEFAGRVETQDRFDRLLAELRQDREAQTRKWEEQNREQNRKWDEQSRKWWEYNREQNRKWDEQNRKWEESKAHFDRVHEEIMAMARKHERASGRPLGDAERSDLP